MKSSWQTRRIGKKSDRMARYRTYKNGITGHRYKGYYIIKGEKKGLFQIWNADRSVYQKDIYDYDECEWIIDKAVATSQEWTTMKQLYGMDIYLLSAGLVELMEKRADNALTEDEKRIYGWVEKIRKRKIEDRKF